MTYINVKNKLGIIYKVTNIFNGKVYIGQTIKSLNERMNEHFRDKRTNYFHNSLKSYGNDNFTWEVLVKCNRENLDLSEEWYIRLYKSYKKEFGYNLTKGGDNNPMDSERVKKKHKESVNSEKERKRRSEYAKINNPMNNVTVKEKLVKTLTSVEHRKKISDLSKEMWKNMSEEKKKKRSEKLSLALSGGNNPSAIYIWIIEKLNGDIIKFDSLREYCRDNLLSISTLWKCCNENRSPCHGKCKGWKISKVKKDVDKKM